MFLNDSNIPDHVGIIMDGNGRWANTRGLPRNEGHRQGSHRSKDIIYAAADMGINVLTLYAFSSENWKRPESEVSTLMELLDFYLKNEIANIFNRGIAFRVIGDRKRLPKGIKVVVEQSEKLTSKNEGMTLVIALSYGGKDEIVRAVIKMAEKGMDLNNIDEAMLESNLDTSGLPPVDLIIRTGGDKRISNFMIWQAAYSELYFTETLWPDFTLEEFFHAIHNYKQRERRFGTILERIAV